MNLTDTTIAKLKWQAKPLTLYGPLGLQLVSYSRGTKTWQLRRMRPQSAERGNTVFIPQVVTLGHWPEMRVSAAVKAARAMRQRIESGEDPGKRPAQVMLRTFGERYLREVAAGARKDLKPVERWLRREIYPALGARRMTQISGDEIQRLVFSKRDRGRPAAAAEIRNTLKRIFDYAQVCGVVETNPVLRTPLKYVYKAKSRTRALSASELRVFLTKSRDSRIGWRYSVILELLLLTLARKSELLTAQWMDVDLAAGTWEVPGEKSKTGKPHIVYLSDRAVRLFEMLWPLDAERPFSAGPHSGTRKLDPSEYVLQSQASRTQPMAKHALNKAMRRIKWGMPHFTPHDLRRTASTILNEKGYNRDWIEVALNHAPQGIRAVYNRALYGEDRRRMLQEWADWLGGLKDE